MREKIFGSKQSLFSPPVIAPKCRILVQAAYTRFWRARGQTLVRSRGRGMSRSGREAAWSIASPVAVTSQQPSSRTMRKVLGTYDEPLR